MPELPEVEISRREIEPYLVGNKIQYCVVRNNHLRWPVAAEILSINNELVLSIKRRAKFLLVQLQHGWIIIHLGMSGSISILTKNRLAKKHDHIDLILTNGKVLRYTDPRRFGAWLWANNLNNHPLLLNLGPEPLSGNFNSNYLYQQAKNKRTTIKSLLMNNKIVVGIGNIYANETLFAAKILPVRITNSLTKKEINNLVIQIKKILQHSIKQGGTTLRNFLRPNGEIGFFAQRLFVYGKSGKPCSYCGQLIKLIKLSQRSTYFCHNCQK